MSAHSVAEVQHVLISKGYLTKVAPDGTSNEDGKAGTLTDAAVAKFQAATPGLAVNGTLTPETLDALFPAAANDNGVPKTITGTIQDYILNLVLSKTNWAAAAMVGALVAFLNTKFGLNIDEKTQAALTVLIAGAFAALIGLLQTAFNSPHMTTKQPAVVQKPAEIK